MIIPATVLVEDDGSTETPSRVDTSSGNGDGSQMHQEHSEPNRQRCQNLLKRTIARLKPRVALPYINTYSVISLVNVSFSASESTYGNVRVSGATLSIGGGEDGVNKNKGANNLSTETITLGVTRGNKVSTTS